MQAKQTGRTFEVVSDHECVGECAVTPALRAKAIECLGYVRCAIREERRWRGCYRRFRRNCSRNGGAIPGTVRISEREYGGDPQTVIIERQFLSNKRLHSSSPRNRRRLFKRWETSLDT